MTGVVALAVWLVIALVLIGAELMSMGEGPSLVVADTDHNRELIWNHIPTNNNAPAVELGPGGAVWQAERRVEEGRRALQEQGGSSKELRVELRNSEAELAALRADREWLRAARIRVRPGRPSEPAGRSRGPARSHRAPGRR